MSKKLFITKYALTEGVIEIESDNLKNKISHYYGKLKNGDLPKTFYKNSEIFETIEEAKKNAEKRRSAKIRSLEMQIHKLNQIEFL